MRKDELVGQLLSLIRQCDISDEEQRSLAAILHTATGLFVAENGGLFELHEMTHEFAKYQVMRIREELREINAQSIR